MSDFLSNLIARSFTDARVIQPRVPSLFESTADESFDERQSPAPAIAAHKTIAPKNGLATEHVSEPLPPREAVTTKSVAHVSDASAEESLLKPDAPAAQNTPAIAQVARPSVHATRVRKLELETQKVIVPSDTLPDGRKHAVNEKPLLEAFREPRAVQPRRRKDFPLIEQPSSPSRPIIRVTIGRVEVRAQLQTPSAQPARVTPAPPKMSLEEYLRGGKR